MKIRIQCFLVVLAFCASLFLAACGQGGTGQMVAEPGRWVETDITPQDAAGEIHLFLQEDGSLLLLDEKLANRWVSTDGGDSWQYTPGTPPIPDVYLLNQVAIGEGDKIYTHAIDKTLISGGSYAGDYVRLAPDGTAHAFTPEELGKSGYVEEIVALPGGRVYIKQGGFVQVEGEDGAPKHEYRSTSAIYDDETGEKLVDVVDGDILSGAMGPEGVFYLLDWAGELRAFDIEGNRQEYQGFLPSGMGLNSGKGSLFVDETGIYFADCLGIAQVGEQQETVVPSFGYTFCDQRSEVTHFVRLETGSFVLVVELMGSYTVLRYDWDETAEVDPEKVLTVWALESSATVRTAMGRFCMRYPAGYVNFEIGMRDGLTIDDAVRNLNLSLLGDSPPDVVILDGLPVDSYIRQDALVDLAGLVDTGTYYENLLAQCVREDGAMFYIPMRFSVAVAAGDTQLLDGTLGGLVAAAQSLPVVEYDTNPLPEAEHGLTRPENFDELWGPLWAANEPFMIKDNSVQPENLAELLEALKGMSDYYGLLDDKEPDHWNGYGITYLSDTGNVVMMGSLALYVWNRTRVCLFMTEDVVVLKQLYGRTGAAFQLAPAIQVGVWRPHTIASIPVASKKQGLAAEFISIMLTDDVQGVRPMEGLPITASGLEVQEGPVQQYLFREAPEIRKWVADTWYYDELIQSLTIMALPEAMVEKSIYDAAVAYCKGETSLEEALRAVEEGLKNYLAEKI